MYNIFLILKYYALNIEIYGKYIHAALKVNEETTELEVF